MFVRGTGSVVSRKWRLAVATVVVIIAAYAVFSSDELETPYATSAAGKGDQGVVPDAVEAGARADYRGQTPRRVPAPTMQVTVIDALTGASIVGASLRVLHDEAELGRATSVVDGIAHVPFADSLRLGDVMIIHAVADGYVDCMLDVAWDPERASSTLRMMWTGHLFGRVVDQHGVGVPECRVAILDSAGGDACKTGEDGRFRLRALCEGSVRLLVHPVINRVSWRGPWVHAAKTGVDATIVLYREERPWCGIRVEAVDHDGNGVALRECEVMPGGDSVGSVMLETLPLAVAGYSASNDRIPPGDWIVRAVARDAGVTLEDQLVTLLPGSEASVLVKPCRPGRLLGRVVGEHASGGGTVVLNPSHGIGVSAGKRFDGLAIVDDDGEFAFEGVWLDREYVATFRKGADIAIARFRATTEERIVLRSSAACSVAWDIGGGLPVDGIVVAIGAENEWSVTGLTNPRLSTGARVTAVLPAGQVSWKYHYQGVRDGVINILTVGGSEDLSGKRDAVIVVRK
ncbi:hypothetical protein N8467_01325 [bacterium]|jgi:hypothetical protein|nr:hypothetical protein [bacterium]